MGPSSQSGWLGLYDIGGKPRHPHKSRKTQKIADVTADTLKGLIRANVERSAHPDG
jgi:hypothetical protein